jgi:hypothetical protein
MDSSTPKLHPAPGKTGEDLDTCSFGRAQSDDAVFCQITPVVKRSRIAIIAGQRNLGGEAQALSVGEKTEGRSAFSQLALRWLLIDIDAQAGFDCNVLSVSCDLLSLDLDPLPDTAETLIL